MSQHPMPFTQAEIQEAFATAAAISPDLLNALGRQTSSARVQVCTLAYVVGTALAALYGKAQPITDLACAAIAIEARALIDGATIDDEDEDEEADPSLDLGPCCICDGPRAVNIVMLHRRAVVPGHGWGCVQCGLPPDGASAVLCDPCLALYQQDASALTQCCRGYPATEGRIAIDDLPEGDFDHDMTKHPEEAAAREGAAR